MQSLLPSFAVCIIFRLSKILNTIVCSPLAVSHDFLYSPLLIFSSTSFFVSSCYLSPSFAICPFSHIFQHCLALSPLTSSFTLLFLAFSCTSSLHSLALSSISISSFRFAACPLSQLLIRVSFFILTLITSLLPSNASISLFRPSLLLVVVLSSPPYDPSSPVLYINTIEASYVLSRLPLLSSADPLLVLPLTFTHSRYLQFSLLPLVLLSALSLSSLSSFHIMYRLFFHFFMISFLP